MMDGCRNPLLVKINRPRPAPLIFSGAMDSPSTPKVFKDITGRAVSLTLPGAPLDIRQGQRVGDRHYVGFNLNTTTKQTQLVLRLLAWPAKVCFFFL